MLAQCHGTEVALEAVERGVLLLLLLEDDVVELGIGEPRLRLPLVLLYRLKKVLVRLRDLALGEVVLTDDAEELGLLPRGEVGAVGILPRRLQQLMLCDLLIAIGHLELELLVYVLELLKLEDIALQDAALDRKVVDR